MTKDNAVAAEAVVAQYRTRFEGDDETVLVHLLADLIEWCDAKRIDLQLSLEEAQQMLREVQ